MTSTRRPYKLQVAVSASRRGWSTDSTFSTIERALAAVDAYPWFARKDWRIVHLDDDGRLVLDHAKTGDWT